MPWREQLKRLVGHGQDADKGPPRDREDVIRFLRDVVTPALEQVARELEGHGREVELEVEEEKVALTVFDGDEEEFHYAVKCRSFRKASFAFPEVTFKDDEQDVYHRAMVYTREGSRDYGILGYDPAQVIANFMFEYDRQLRWQKPTRRR